MRTKGGSCELKFRSMLFTGTLTRAVIYIMFLCDHIIAGHFIGETGIAAVNAITPVSGTVTFLASIISIGTGIQYSREIGAMRKRRADEIFGQQGLILSILLLCKGVYSGRPASRERSMLSPLPTIAGYR